MKDTDQLIERHPFTPFLPQGCKIVFCGTFPPKPNKWAMEFFYPNFYNDMWRVFGNIYYNDKDHFFNLSNKTIDRDGIMEMLTNHKIGIGETATEVVRTKDNASDKYLEIVTPVNLQRLFDQVPACEAIITTGEKAASIIADITTTPVPKMGEMQECCIEMADKSLRKFQHWRMPSTSRAYPMTLEKKTAYYHSLLKRFDLAQ